MIKTYIFKLPIQQQTSIMTELVKSCPDTFNNVFDATNSNCSTRPPSSKIPRPKYGLLKYDGDKITLDTDQFMSK